MNRECELQLKSFVASACWFETCHPSVSASSHGDKGAFTLQPWTDPSKAPALWTDPQMTEEGILTGYNN